MSVSREETIQRASDFANTNGYRVVQSFDGLPWVHSPLPVKFDTAYWLFCEWYVLFDKMLHSEVLFECPSDICVVVDPASGECRFYSML